MRPRRPSPSSSEALAPIDALGRIHFFKALIEKADGDYDGGPRIAANAWRRQYPRDRVVLNQIARILFLKRRYSEALAVLERVAAVDPEDVQMHYTAMLCYARPRRRGARRAGGEAVPALQGRRSSQAITAERRG